jgi:hypothetical protein
VKVAGSQNEGSQNEGSQNEGSQNEVKLNVASQADIAVLAMPGTVLLLHTQPNTVLVFGPEMAARLILRLFKAVYQARYPGDITRGGDKCCEMYLVLYDIAKALEIPEEEVRAMDGGEDLTEEQRREIEEAESGSDENDENDENDEDEDDEEDEEFFLEDDDEEELGEDEEEEEV